MNQDNPSASSPRLVQNQASCHIPRMNPDRLPGDASARLISCILVGLAVAATFWPVLRSVFINLDDGEYVLENPHVATGLSAANIVWALSTGYASNWHPLTWLSHMLDVQIFGLNPAGHHLVNLLLHAANAIILLLLLARLTRAPWRSFCVSALFALHPLHVESVAWVAERKDVLSTLFFLVTIWAYARYAVELREAGSIAAKASATPRVGRFYRLALLFFVLGLLSKPMLVTLPFVLLLLDYWPLRRVARSDLSWPVWSPLVKEKLPFLALAIISCVITVAVQARAHSVKLFLPLSLRLENAVVSYVTYLARTVWPARLSVFYPHPNTRFGLPQTDLAHPASEQWPLASILVAGTILVAVSLFLLKMRRRSPWLAVGWFWYLGTLVPVIGLVQVGMQATADRYTYIPLIGVFIAVVWGVAELAGQRRFVRPVVAGVAGLVLLSCAVVARHQSGFWHDDFSLFQHALTVTTNNAMAECHVGVGLAKQGRLDLAESHFKAALADDPFFYAAHSSLGSLYEIQGQPDQAMQQYQATLRMRSWDEFARIHLAGLLHKSGRDDQAIAEYKQNLLANPDSVEGNYQLGALLLDRGELDSAGPYLAKAVDLKPDHVDALLCLSDVRVKQGKLTAAQAALEAVVKLYPTNFELRINFASLLWQSGKEADALDQYNQAIRLQPAAPIGHYDLAVACAAHGQLTDAARELEEAVRLKPDYAEALSELAWLLATNPRPQERNGARALALSRRALELGAAKQARTWAALDVAYAETGQFADAISAAEKARDLAAVQGQTNAVKSAQERLLLYKTQKAFHLQ